ITQLEGRLDGVKNFCFTAQEIGDDIVFLRKLIHGEAGQSFGIHVARLAGLPQNVLAHAAELLENFNSRGAGRAPNFERAGRAPNFERAGRAPDFDEPSPKTKRRPENENKNSRAEKNKFADEISREEKNKFSDENIFADEISREGKNKNEEKNILADALREIEIEKITPLEAIVALARLKEML
ncbi:MAG: hypothetical protein FWD19_00635, partial [Defluviitaleaceae bacterium]|nr:hypothetical protein [Defluviitaleaceae bacterium]